MDTFSGRIFAILILSLLAHPGSSNAQGIEPADRSGCGSGSCCVAHGMPGCNDSNCCDDVCFLDDFCCKVGWTDSCVGLAQVLCGDLCDLPCPSNGDCCQTHTGGGCEDANCCKQVCSVNSACCDGSWSSSCVELAEALCDTCAPPPTCSGTGDGPCCSAHTETGCDRESCCATVCDLDPKCCAFAWDNIFAREARDNCNNVCVCSMFGDFDNDGLINLKDVHPFQNCYSGSAGTPIANVCACGDYDGDDRVDLSDYRRFEETLSMP